MTLIALQPKFRSPCPWRSGLRQLRQAACTAALLGAMAGCGSGGGGPAPSAPPASETPPPTPGAHASAGCGAAAKFSTGYQSVMSDGVQRSYWVELPAHYDPSTPYPVVIGLHWRDGSADDVRGWSGYFGLKNEYGDTAIFVAPQGLDAGWANPGDRDIRFMRSMISQLQQGACTDTQRVFATGFSFGGMMSNAIGCQMGDVVRAIAPMGSSLWSGCASSSYRVAAVFFHAQDDNTVPYSAGEEARNVFTTRNGCRAETAPVGSNGCVEYQGCSADKPVVWCGSPTGGHWYPGFSAKETKTFFDRF